MACFKPLSGWRARGSGPVLFNKPVDIWCTDIQVPCGQCIGCRLERSRQWASRCMHEASLHDDNCFITLTYDEDHLPHGGSLVKSDFQKFLKRFRKKCGPLRFFHCGEYGSQLSRPHYHACIFGFDFPDKVLFKRQESGDIYTSHLLDSLWSFGFATVGALTFESAAYVARYVLKKVTGDDADSHYLRVSDFGEAFQVEPEYVTMSRRPGIGRGWFERWSNEVYPSDEIVVRGHLSKPPRYYDDLQAIAEPCVFDVVKQRRVLAARERAFDNTPERLRVKEVCSLARVARLKRALDD